jgi:galactokinase
MTGGGFGGSVIVLVPIDRTTDVAAAVIQAFNVRGQPDPRCQTAAPSAGARRLR